MDGTPPQVQRERERDLAGGKEKALLLVAGAAGPARASRAAGKAAALAGPAAPGPLDSPGAPGPPPPPPPRQAQVRAPFLGGRGTATVALRQPGPAPE